MLRPFAVFILAASFSFPVLADEFIADSKLVAATVYTNRAAVTRRAEIDLPAGAHTVVFNGLPESLFPDSLRAEGKALATVAFGAVTHKQIMSADLTVEREKELNDQLEALQDQRALVEGEKGALSAKMIFLNSIGNQATLRTNEDIAEIDLKPDQWAAAADAVYNGTASILKDIHAQDILLRGLDRQIDKIRAESRQHRNDRRSTYQVVLPLEADKATHLTVELSYQVPEASWNPLYDARLDTGSGTLELVQYGAVRQDTGEDWKGIALTLSTAQPQRGTTLPDPRPLWVNIRQAHIYQAPGDEGDVSESYRKAVEETNVAAVEEAIKSGTSALPVPIAPPVGRLSMEDEPRKAKFVYAQVETGGFVSEYKIPGPSSVPADGTESKLMVGHYDIESSTQIRAHPQISSEAYLMAQARLKGESPVLPGKVNLFRDGAYVGQASLPLLRPGEEQHLGFGVDDQVSVRRKVMKDEKSETGLIARDQALERRFLTEIQNLHSNPVDIAIFENIPVSRDEKIKAEILAEATTSGYAQDVDNIKGLLRWTVSLKPKEKTEVKAGWKVSWPKDQSVTGL